MFFDQFKAICSSLGTSPTSIAKKIGVTSANVTHWKNGSIPNGDVLLKISKELNCSTDYLLGNTDDPSPPSRDLPDWVIDISDLSDKDKKEVLLIIEMKRANQ